MSVSPDPVLYNDWHPVALGTLLGKGYSLPVVLLGAEVVVWRSANDNVYAWEDRCPHRGTRFSIGRVENDQLVCAYHGWKFATNGQCTLVPAHPDLPPPPKACARTYHACERYGLIWVCLGEPTFDVFSFPEIHDQHLRKVWCGPYDVAASGPRIVENFLDMGHFGSVHEGILGNSQHMAVRDYEVAQIDDGAGNRGPLATGCFAWQPQTNSLAHGGSDVEYTYRVVRPLTAILTKIPEAQEGFREAISLHVQPLGEESSRVWIILAMTNFDQSDEALRKFQDNIFLQDKPILENQMPRRLPLSGEVPVRCDRMSSAYRRHLRAIGLRHGVINESL